MEGVSKEQVVQYLSQPERCMQIIDHSVNVFIEEGVSIKVEYEESNSSAKYLWVTVVEQIKKRPRNIIRTTKIRVLQQTIVSEALSLLVQEL